MLSAAASARAKAFIHSTARPLENALLDFHFAHGSRDVVIAELAKFQNSDGGFGSSMESDIRWPGSSAMATMKGLRLLRQVRAPADDVHVQAAIRYLLASFDYANGYWHALPKEANTAPHAPWWHYHEETGKCEVESPVFPTAAIAGYLHAYAGSLPEGFLGRITQSSLNYLAAAPLRMEMPDIEMSIELARCLPQDRSNAAVAKLRSVLDAVVVRDPQQWTTYNLKPLTFIHTPDSPYYAGLENEVAGELDYLVATQMADGGWALTWSWENIDPIAWEVARKEWRAVVTLENLKTLDAFHHIAC